MNNTDYSIDEVKLMAKVKRYKRRWEGQRHYSEYLKCKLAKKATQVQKLKTKSANWRDTAIQLSANCGTAMAEIDRLKARLMDYENNGRMEDLQKENERLRKEVALFDSRWEDQNIYRARLVAELAKEKNRNGNLNAHIKGLQTMLDTRGVEIDKLNGGMEELEAENARLQEHANNLSDEVADLHNRRMVEVRTRNRAEAMVERLIEAGNSVIAQAFAEEGSVSYSNSKNLMNTIAEWKEREVNGK